MSGKETGNRAALRAGYVDLRGSLRSREEGHASLLNSGTLTFDLHMQPKYLSDDHLRSD